MWELKNWKVDWINKNTCDICDNEFISRPILSSWKDLSCPHLCHTCTPIAVTVLHTLRGLERYKGESEAFFRQCQLKGLWRWGLFGPRWPLFWPLSCMCKVSLFEAFHVNTRREFHVVDDSQVTLVLRASPRRRSLSELASLSTSPPRMPTPTARTSSVSSSSRY